ncbi:hypothetical protein [Cellulomonas septica]|uniref:Polymerase nucleotidyl transferase domain-containing protein n=1 Tax=Cellulomonas septica TaxID=285080 RepID=A0ABX1JXZ6_9CELL|nr:hypothetical protein [Cellulomonas septica]NKY39209.1 hypothetical protein [Cellulomonas septica]
MPVRSFDDHTAALVAAVRAHPSAAGLVLLGSAARSEAARRDEWSDHDFFVIAADGKGEEVRDVRAWLPDVERVVTVAREGAIGFAVLYDDGHLMEFAAATGAELGGATVVHHDVVIDEDGTLAALVESSGRRAADEPQPDPANDAALALVKLMVGVGRARRGEVLSGGEMVRQWAVKHLVLAIRARIPTEVRDREAIDPARRFEAAYPQIAPRLAAALAAPVEDAARALHALARDVLEPGWEEFPSATADVVAARLGWAPTT